jgi:ectoine hydroxylase-related dioxygenase (phytanoyl-CoA dioxygenase family)
LLIADKEKLNFKPPGGAGFAPHLDAPSLRVGAVGTARTFMTLMVAIDAMTATNGCLRVARGSWSEQNHCEVIRPDEGLDPDAGGRAGAIPPAVADTLDFEDVICAPGDVVAFNGWAPHRSGVNPSPFERRAVFLTYNPLSEGDMHEAYYDKMAEIRSAWRARELGRFAELAALTTVPK